MGPTLDHQSRRLVRQGQRHKHRLEDERGRPRSADGEFIIARRDRSRLEDDAIGAKLQAFALGPADGASGLDRGQVLAHQARLVAARTDLLDRERLAGDKRQRAGVAEHLPAAFPL